MKKFMESNPGLARRFPEENRLHFPNYNPEELLTILFQMIETRGFTCSAEAKKEIGRGVEEWYY